MKGAFGVDLVTDQGHTVGASTPTPIDAYHADVRIRCDDCDEPFRFIGAPAGVMPNRPCVSVDETELRAPIRPASSDPDFGLGIPGFAVRYVDGAS